MLTERHFLVFWPDEDSYSDVPECKIVGNPGPLGEAIQVRERQRIYTGLLVAVGSKQEVQKKLNAIEVQEQVPEPMMSTINPVPVPTVPAESQPKASKKQGIKILVMSVDCCAS